MKKGFEIIEDVLEKFRGLPIRLAAITGKTSEWFSSHGRESKTQNPLSSGNLSPVDHYLQFCRQYEAAASGAGKMLNNRVHFELESEFGDERKIDCSQIELHTHILKESFDVLRCLNEKNFATSTTSELAKIEQECMELRDAASDVIAHLRAVKRVKQAHLSLIK